jgi:two-component system response regulator RegA
MSEERSIAIVVDDDDVYRDRLCRALSDRGWDATGARNGTEAIQLAERESPDLALVDLRMPGMSGLDLIQELRRLDDTMCIIMLTGYGSIPTAITATRLGADHYLSKPTDADQILAAYEKSASGEAEGTSDASIGSVPSLARVEWEHIQRVLADNGGNISLAAKLLGLHRRSLQRKLSKHPPHR